MKKQKQTKRDPSPTIYTVNLLYGNSDVWSVHRNDACFRRAENQTGTGRWYLFDDIGHDQYSVAITEADAIQWLTGET